VAAGGVVFTTIHKFFPEEKGDRHPVLSDRRNIVVIADEAHRSQYDFIDGFARHMRDALPHASFIGFTGTPIELADANTRAVFGDYISIYDIQRAVEDGATVPIYYESRLAKLDLPEELKPRLDAEFEEVTEGEEIERKERLKTKWAQLEAVVAHGERLPFADATFDCAVASKVIEHLPEPERVLDEMWRVVRPGGRVLISTPYRERIRYVLCIHCNQPTPIHAHLNSFDEHRLASYLRQGRFGFTTFGNKALLLARTHVLLGRVPHWLWRLVDRLANKILPKPAHIVAWWDRV
jgi:type I restriction enzyme R subunit